MAPATSRIDKRTILWLIVGLVVTAGIIVAVYGIVGKIEAARLAELEIKDMAARESSGQASFVEWKGGTYKRRTNLYSVLVMGIDRTSDSQPPMMGFRNQGQADFLLIIVIDKDAKTVERLMLDRDTMTPITTLGVFGDVSGSRVERLSLSHSFGDGKDQSCLLTLSAVSGLLMHAKIDSYVALNLEAIPKLNDMVGGVTVIIEDDFSASDLEMVKGATVTLHGNQAERFVRSRMGVGGGTNEERMHRQRVFLDGLNEKVEANIKADIGFLDRLFDEIYNDMVTNMARGRIVNEYTWAQKYETKPIYTIAGKHEIDDRGFMAFYADEEAVEGWVMGTFFKPVE